MEEKTYKELLIRKSDNKYIDFNPFHDKDHQIIDGYYFVEWNKPLPEDIDSVQYKYENGALIRS